MREFYFALRLGDAQRRLGCEGGMGKKEAACQEGQTAAE